MARGCFGAFPLVGIVIEFRLKSPKKIFHLKIYM